jgi:serine/threonine protein kinase
MTSPSGRNDVDRRDPVGAADPTEFIPFAADKAEALLDQYWSDVVRADPQARGEHPSWLHSHHAPPELADDLRLLDALAELRCCDTPDRRPIGDRSSIAAGPGATTHPAAPLLPNGTLLGGKLRILGPLRAGGMGEVYLAWHESLHRQVAVKVVPGQFNQPDDSVHRFHKSIQAQAQLGGHEHIAGTMDAGDERGLAYLVMEYVPGQDLAAYLGRHGPLPWREACAYIRQAALGLHHAHGLGLVHRDIKPSNLVRDRRGTIKLLDWGLARSDEGGHASERLTATGIVMGTPDYLPPEQADDSKTADGRSDLYSLGCTFYCLLTGKPPFADRPSGRAKLKAHALDTPPPIGAWRDDVPRVVEAIVKRLLEKEPDHRFQSAAELTAALDAIPGDAPPAPRSRRRRPLIATVLAIATVASIAWGAWTLHTPRPAAKVRVLSIDVQHYTRLNDNDAQPQGLLGRESFTAQLGDQVTIEARLSRPAYSYLLVFRPDGVADVCFPDDETQPPPLTDRPRYPPPSKPDKRYGVREGTGLWVIAVVTSEQPLPAYRDFVATHKPVWTPPRPDDRKPSDLQTVWWYDGHWIEPFTGYSTKGSRTKEEQALGTPAAVVAAAQWLKTATGGETVAAIGFTVGPAR